MKKLAGVVVLLMTFVSESEAQEARARTEKIHVKVGGANPEEAVTLADWGITKIPKYRALIIGVSEYQYASAGLRNLVEPINDAQKLYDVLTTHYTFDQSDVMFL